MDELLKVLQGMNGLLRTQMLSFEERLVDRFECEKFLVSTMLCLDLEPPYQYETAVSHHDYDEGKIIPVESYVTKEEAQEGHNRWVEVMKNPPTVLEDGGQSYFGNIIKSTNPLIYEKGNE